MAIFLVPGAKRWTACQSWQGTSLVFSLISKVSLWVESVEAEMSFEQVGPGSSPAVDDNVCVFTALIVIGCSPEHLVV